MLKTMKKRFTKASSYLTLLPLVKVYARLVSTPGSGLVFGNAFGLMLWESKRAASTSGLCRTQCCSWTPCALESVTGTCWCSIAGSVVGLAFLNWLPPWLILLLWCFDSAAMGISFCCPFCCCCCCCCLGSVWALSCGSCVLLSKDFGGLDPDFM